MEEKERKRKKRRRKNLYLQFFYKKPPVTRPRTCLLSRLPVFFSLTLIGVGTRGDEDSFEREEKKEEMRQINDNKKIIIIAWGRTETSDTEVSSFQT